MKHIFLTVIGVTSISLMSFFPTKNNDIIEVQGNIISVKQPEKLSKLDLKFLRENVEGWTYCKQYSETKNCNTMNRNFPDEPKKRLEVKRIIEKYQ